MYKGIFTCQFFRQGVIDWDGYSLSMI